MRTTLALATALAALATAACTEEPTTPQAPEAPGIELPSAASHLAGNDFPKGGHDYKLNIIGVPKDKTAAMDNNNGHRIFVQLESDNEVTEPGGKNNHLAKGGGNDQNHIYLCNSTNDEGDSTDPRCEAYGNPDNFGVIDANATDGDGALLAVPDPCEGDDSTDGCSPTYAIYARALAGGGNATITTCAEEVGDGFDETDDTWCGSNGLIEIGTNHGRKAVDVSDNLLYMTISVDDATDPDLAACIDPDGDSADLLPDEYDVYLFDRCFEDYFWNYDNNGLKLLELRFYAD